MDMVSLYVLRCPETGEIRYAGKANDPKVRLHGHIKDSMRSKRPVCCWVAKLLDKGLSPVMEVVKEVPFDSWQVEEISLIARLRNECPRLLNVADGGDAPSCTHEQRKSNGISMNKKRDATPYSKRLNEMKRQLGIYLRTAEKNEAYERIVSKLRLAAKKSPRLFGNWASL